MLISDFADSQRGRVKPLANTATFVYNGKVNQGKEKSNLPGCIYLTLTLIVMTKEEARKLLQECVDLHLEVGRDWMRGDWEGTPEHWLKTQSAGLAAQDVLEWFKQEEKSYGL